MRLTKRTVCALLGALVFLVAIAAASGPVFATTFYTTNTSTSVGTPGGNALILSGKAYPNGASVAVVSNGDDWTQAAGAGVLAHVYGGPLLLSASSSLTPGVAAELLRLEPTTVYVVGLSDSVGTQIGATLAGLSPVPQIVVLTGTDAYQTAVLVARQVKTKLGTVQRVVIVPADRVGGVLAGSAIADANGWPILLTPAAGPFSQVSQDAITELGATAGICLDTTVGPNVSGFAVEQTITGSVSSSDPDGRYGLCSQAAQYAVSKGYLDYDQVGLVSGDDVASGQAVASYLSGRNGVLLLSTWSRLSDAAAGVMTTHGREISTVSSVGLPWSLIRQVKSLNSACVTAVSPNSGPVAGGNSVVVTGTGLDSVTSVVVGKTVVPASDWRLDTGTQLTILATPKALGPGPAEVILQNYWNRSPATVADLYRYAGNSPALPGDMVVNQALKYIGVPYVWAGASPSGGFDCSGLAMYVYKQLGFSLPHYSAAQAGYGTPVSKDNLLPGDLVFFFSPISHVGIYVGNGLMINAPRSGDLVTIEDVNRSSYTTARRIFSPYTRYQQNNGLVAYAGWWSTNTTKAASGGNFYLLSSSGWVSVRFNGTSLGWVGKTGPQYGIAAVTVDGGAPVNVDLYTATGKNQSSVWNTGTLSPGEHTVTIRWTGAKNRVARSNIVDVDAFDVAGNLVQAPGLVWYQQNDAHLVHAGAWKTSYTARASAGSYAYVNSAAKVTVSFNGTYFSWFTKTGPLYGKAKLTVDGGPPVLVDLYRRTAAYGQKVYCSGILSDGAHTATIEWTGAKNRRAKGRYICTDVYAVMGELTDGTTPPAVQSGTRHEENDPMLGYAGSWSPATDAGASGGSLTSVDSSSQVVVCFEGTSLNWIATKGAADGIANVTLDDKAPVPIDLYSPTSQYRQIVYQTGDLTKGPHTLTIGWTGTKNSAATDSNVVVDAFDIQGDLTQAPAPVRYEENAPQIAYAGQWSPVGSAGSASGGAALCADSPGASATISFNGAYVAWIAKKSSVYGKAKVFLDGADPVTVDLYSATTVWQQRVWNSGILPAGPHTLTIQWSWGRNTAATDANLSLDAFEVLGDLTPATAAVMHSGQKVVVIDPGHQAQADTGQEPVGPGSTTTKDKVSSGTASINTGSPESALVLTVGLKLRDALSASGIQVVMTRETEDVDISNAQRAQIANDAHADLLVRIHADGVTDQSVNGILVLYPATIKGWTDDIATESLRGATIALQEMTKATGAKSRGLSARSDLAGFNWSDVPTYLTEIGLMTNPTEDALMATDAYQNKLVAGLSKAILCYLDIY